jgi:SIR2-like domain
MPTPELRGPCTFDGVAASVRVQGHGHASLLARKLFEDGWAARVRLGGATISAAQPSPEIVAPVDLIPVGPNRPGRDYDVTYSAGIGAPIVAEIAGGGQEGSFKGRLEGAPECASAWCTVDWSGTNGKRIELFPAKPEAPGALTLEFPFGATEPSTEAAATARPWVKSIELRGASGTLTCAGEARKVGGGWDFTGGELKDLVLKPLRIEGSVLHAIVQNAPPPQEYAPVQPDAGPAPATSASSTGQPPVRGTDPSPSPFLPISLLALGIAVVTLLFVRRPRATQSPLPPPPRAAPTEVPPMDVSPLPAPLVAAYRAEKLALFVGSGLSLGAGVKGGFPTWSQIPTRLLDACERYDALDAEAIAVKRRQFAIRMSLEQMLSELGTLRTALGRSYQAALNDIFRPDDAAPGDAHRAVAALGVRTILTTNYDQLFELLHETPPRQPYSWKEADRALADVEAGRKVLLKIHGTAERHETVVMSDREYDAARVDASYQAVLRYLLQDHVFLFLGYGMNDPLDLDLAFEGNADAFKTSAKRHYVLLQSPTDADKDRLARDYNVRVIPYAAHADVPVLLASLAATRAAARP